MTTKITEQNISNLANAGVDWQSVVVADGSTNTTSVSGKGYFIDTSGGAHTLNLPASPNIGDIIKVTVITAGNALTIGRNGNNINGSASDLTSTADGDAYELVYVNASEGWKSVGKVEGGAFISATGGTVTTSGNFKIHTFTGDGCFAVAGVGNGSSNPLGGPSTIDYLVVAGGGSGGNNGGGGGGGGGFRESKDSGINSPHTASPLATSSGITVSATTYPVTVGGGGATAPASPSSGGRGTSGSNSVFSTVTSAGGGAGGAFLCGGPLMPGNSPGANGGSGGGGSAGTPGVEFSGGTGNTPPVSPPQGNGGGAGKHQGGSYVLSGGGGGAAGAGGNYVDDAAGGAGGTGIVTHISGSPTGYSGGAAGAGFGPRPPGSPGGGGAGNPQGTGPSPGCSTAGSANTGGGGGSASHPNYDCASAGGSGVVIIRYKYQ